jgi:hypothetical protein
MRRGYKNNSHPWDFSLNVLNLLIIPPSLVPKEMHLFVLKMPRQERQKQVSIILPGRGSKMRQTKEM